ncbi:MAG: SDR family oxidoreductase [Paracoccaceae bacterium]|nr:SDR family oxidoreductase [Paracoccaceae bacterium]
MNILITGASSGFGKLIVTDLVKAGHQVVGSMRDIYGRNAAAKAEFTDMGVEIVEIDVTDDASVEAGVAAAAEKLGRIDVLINNAGVGAHGLQENFSAGDFQRLFDINVFGVQRMIRAALPGMRARGNGLIVNISSLLGRVALPFYGPYNASKWALEAMSENYRAELSQFGVDFTIVEPGGFPTRFIDNLMQPASRDRDEGYGQMAGAPKASLEGFEGFLAANPQQNPQLVADAVVDVIATAPGSRPFRTEVDRIGMAEPLKAYNDHLAQVTTGLFANLGMEGMLQLKTVEDEAA